MNRIKISKFLPLSVWIEKTIHIPRSDVYILDWHTALWAGILGKEHNCAWHALREEFGYAT